MRAHLFPSAIVKPKFQISSTVKGISVLHPIELFGSKIKALIERTAARDLYDVHNMISKEVFSEDQMSLLRKSILFYLAVGGSNPPKIEYTDFESISELKYPQIRKSLIPVLNKNEKFDFENAKIGVKHFLLNQMQLSEPEKEFVRMFNKKKYIPELLFEDKNIVERIRRHPMAIWKMR